MSSTPPDKSSQSSDEEFGEQRKDTIAADCGASVPLYSKSDAQVFDPETTDKEDLWGQWTDATPYRSLDDNLNAAPANQQLLVNAMKRIVNDEGGTFMDPGIKTNRGRMEQKLKAREHAGKLTDIVRGGVMVDSPEHADAILQKLGEQYQVADEGWKLTPAGYFDRKVIVRFPDGQVGELQMWQPELFHAKEQQGGHRMYEEWRSLPEGDPQKLLLEQQMKELYDGVRAQLDDRWKQLF